MSVYIKEPNAQAQACIIWMHGLGSNAEDMMGLSEEMVLSDLNVRHVYMDAPQRPVTLNNGMVMPAWYDILGLEFSDREDQPGIQASADLIRDVIDEQIKEGFAEQQIYLAGFSQGGAMALYTALQYKARLGGVIALSAYLPIAQHIKPQLDKATPFFMAMGQFDPLILPSWTEQSRMWLAAHQYVSIDFHAYPMEHSVCYEEVGDLSRWLMKQVNEVVQ